MPKPFTTRLEKLRRLMRKADLPALLVSNRANVTYLTGFTGEDSYLLVSRTDTVILSDTRFTTQLEEECPGFELSIRDSSMTLLQLVQGAVGKMKLDRLAIEADAMTVGTYRQLKHHLASVQIASSQGLVETLREIKDRGEIDEIRRSVVLAERVFGVIRASLRPDQTEREIANQIEYQIRSFGGRGCSFPSIVAVGSRAALPHAVPTERTISESDFVLIDWGAFAGHYASDLTRVLVTGRISPKLERIYGVVLKAQQQAIELIRPGALMSDIDAAARATISKAGYGKRFGHGLGHGIGLEIHEAPRIAAKQNRPLEVGMVVTVEPGIYIPGWGGVRIEDDVLVTRDGHEVLTTVPKDLESCVV